jgi:hypothetical protein
LASTETRLSTSSLSLQPWPENRGNKWPEKCESVWVRKVRKCVARKLRKRLGQKGAEMRGRLQRSRVSRPVVTIEPVEQDHQQLLDAIVKLERQKRILAAVVRILLAMLRASGFTSLASGSPKAAPKPESCVPSPVQKPSSPWP